MKPASDSILPKRPLAGPAMKVCLAFIAGILLSGYIHIAPYTSLSLLGACVLLLFLTHRKDTAGSLCALSVMVLSGLCAASAQREINKPLDIPRELTGTIVGIEGYITGSPRYNYGNTSFVLDCTRFDTGSAAFNVRGMLPCRVYGKTIPLNEGAFVFVRGKIRRIRHPFNKSDIMSGFIQRKYTHRLAVDSTSPEPVIIMPGKSFFSALRTSLSRLIDRYPYGGHREILRAMTIGNRDGIPQEIRARFAQTGIAHILAVSGLHVGIIAALCWFLLIPLPLYRKHKFLLILIVLVLYAGICGFRPPVTRAVIMAAMLMGPLLLERLKNMENSLFVALIVILAFNPQALYGPSLQLSFAAVWTIITFYTPLMEIFKMRVPRIRFIKYIVGILTVSVLAYIGTAPIIATHFGSLPLYGIPANFPGIPLAFLIVTLGTASIVMTAPGAVTEPIAAVLSYFTGFLLRILDWLTEFVSNLPCSSIETGSISLLAGIIFASWLYSLSRSTGRPVFKRALLYIPMVSMLIMTWNPIVITARYGISEGTVVFFDAGQGDAALIRYGNSRAFLVDTGPHFGTTGIAETVILPTLTNLGITSLDGIFISHTHADHSGGLASIVKKMQVDHIFCRTTLQDSLASLYGDRIIGLSAGDSIAFSEGGMLVLSPGTNHTLFMSDSHSGENNRSLLVRCDIAGERVLFTGDIETNIQELMVPWGLSLRADILKTPHHGAQGLNQDFVKAVAPVVSVISCGAGNRYGHPAQSTLTTLSQVNSSIWRTDRDGAVIVRLPGLSISSYESNYYNNRK